MSGAVEVLRAADPDGSTLSHSVERSFTIDVDESLALECAGGGAHEGAPVGAVDGRLHIDRAKVRPALMRR
jgi:hypothetical protein